LKEKEKESNSNMAGTAAAKAMLMRLGLSTDAAEEITSATVGGPAPGMAFF